MKPERIAVLGAGGFIGSHLVPVLLAARERPVEITAVDLTLRKLEVDDPRVRRVEASIDRPGLLDELTARATTVVSLTALCNPSLYNTRPLDVIDASYTDLVPLVKLCAPCAQMTRSSSCLAHAYVQRSRSTGPKNIPVDSSFIVAVGRPSASSARRPYTSHVEKCTSRTPRAAHSFTRGTRSV